MSGYLFEPGAILVTPGVATLATVPGCTADLGTLILRHLRGDWGDVPPDDAAANARALRAGDRIMSSYRFSGERVWIITEADRSVTTILLPEEY